MPSPSVGLLALERLGYGLSDIMQDRTLEDWNNDVVEMMDQLEISKFSIYAVSGGAPYPLSCSSKLGERIDKVVIVGGLGPVYLPEFLTNLSQEEKASFHAALQAPESLIAFTQKAQKNPAAFVEKIIASMSESERSAIPPLLIESYIQLVSESTKKPDGMISDYKIFAKDWSIIFEEIQIPIHFWHSESDKSVPISHSEYVTNLIPNSKLTRLTDKNHYTTSLATVEDVLRYFLED
jgi:pimeloyl-ACP methyl ester carboxylesterase